MNRIRHSRLPGIIISAFTTIFFLSVNNHAASLAKDEILETQDNRDALFTYYKSYGVMTDPGANIKLYDNLPDEISDLYRMVQGLLIHAYHLNLYGVTLPEQRMADAGIRKVEDMLERIMELDDSPIIHARDPQKRLVGNCRSYALMMCSVLKHKGIPARARNGFATYFYPGYYEDHWICEYWNKDSKKWIKVDAQLDSVHIKDLKIDFDPMNLPSGKFIYAGMVYHMCEQGDINPEICGIGKMRGLWFVRGNVIRDFMALNNMEILPWDSTELMNVEKYPSQDISSLIDTIITLTTSQCDSLSEIRAVYQKHPGLRMPDNWKP